MLRSIKGLYGYRVSVQDGDIGKVKDFYFDDENLTIRYLVVDTGKWLSGKRVLISPAAFYGQPDGDAQIFSLILTKKAVKKCPAVGTNKPVSRQKEEDKGDSHLRSAKEVIGYFIQAEDGKIGHVEDFLVDDKEWKIRYMVVHTRNWLSGKKVLVAPTWIGKIDCLESKVYVSLFQEHIKNSPKYDPSTLAKQKY